MDMKNLAIYDEDISEPEEKSDKEPDPDCECDGQDSECECMMSDHSYNGPDADLYYEFKEEREKRKWELKRIQARQRKKKAKQRGFEKSKEKKVQDALEALRKAEKGGKRPRLDPSVSKHFNLYSTDHVDHCYSSRLNPSKYIEFYYLDGIIDCSSEKAEPKEGPREICGHFYFDSDTGCNVESFHWPDHASSKPHRLESHGGNHDLEVQFISSDYLKLTLSRELVFKDRREPEPSDAPPLFEFYGVRSDREKAMAERAQQAAKRKRSVSPRESWGEANGWY